LTPLPFAGIVATRPYPPTGLATWAGVPVETVDLAALVLTQRHLGSIAALFGAERRPGGDAYPQVVRWAGVDYLEDGHHKVCRAALWRGALAMRMRVYRHSGEVQA
jgi:hypothetical protein